MSVLAAWGEQPEMAAETEWFYVLIQFGQLPAN
jgi:hypothetical protein